MEGKHIKDNPPQYRESGCLWFAPTITQDEDAIPYEGKLIYRGNKIEIDLAIHYAHHGNIVGTVLEQINLKGVLPFPATDIDIRRCNRGEWNAQSRSFLLNLFFYTLQEVTLSILVQELDRLMHDIEKCLLEGISIARLTLQS